MLNTSKEFREQAGISRSFYVTANCTLSDGTAVPIEKKDFYLSGNGIVDSSDSSEFPLGLAIEKTATLSLVNDKDKFSDYNFNRARFVLYVNLQLPSGRTETLKKGTFIVSKKPSTGNRINLTLLDRMYLADKKYDSRLTFPATAGEVLRDCCQSCGIALGDATFPNSGYIVSEKPENTTYRAVIGFCAMLAGGNARIDHDDFLRIITFDKDTQATVLDGGLFSPWTKGGVTSGGTFRPWTTGGFLDGEHFGDREGLYVFSAVNNLSYDTDDIEVTGVKAVVDDVEYVFGNDGYVLTIQNPLISGNVEEALQMIGGQVIGLTMRPFSLQNTADPTMEFMDPCVFSDVKGNLYFSYITNVDFLFNGYTKAANTTKSLEENAAEFFSGNSVAVEQAKKNAEKLLSGYDIGVRHMNELAANTLGFYYTEAADEDGSITAYRHDKPELSESKIVYKNGIDGFFVTREYTGDDKTTQWSSGFDKNGDAVLNILYAIGIQAEWINTRGFTAKDNAGDITFRINAETGEVEIAASKFSLSGKGIAAIAQEQAASEVNDFVTAIYSPAIANLQAQIDGQIETWYYDYEPALDNVPASGWKTEADRAKHEGDLFYWKSKGYSYRFLKDGSWKWQVITDSDITKALADAAAAQDTADSKRRVFVTIPKPPYDEGDLWAQGTGGDIMTCITSRHSGVYSPSDWKKMNKYIDQSAAENAASSAVNGQTQEDIFNRLFKPDGIQIEGVKLENGKLYISASYIYTGILKLGGANNINGEMKILDASGSPIVEMNNKGEKFTGSDGTSFVINGANLSSRDETGNEYGFIGYTGGNSSSPKGINIASREGAIVFSFKSASSNSWHQALTIYSGKELNDKGLDFYRAITASMPMTFTTGVKFMGGGGGSGTQGIMFTGLLASSSGTTLAVNSNGALHKLSSSSMRYKDINREMLPEDTDALYAITPVWAKYREGYLSSEDERNGVYFPMLIAEDVEANIPLAADHNAEGDVEDWNQRVLIPYMIQALKEQKDEIDMLKACINK